MATTDSRRRLIKVFDLPSDATLNATLYNDVKTYGAVGDGVNDDTSAIQAAIDDTTPYGVVALPPGTYKITSTLTLGTRGVQVRGAGVAGAGVTGAHITTILKAGNFHGITIGHGDQIIRDLQVKGDTGNGGDGITVEQIKVCIQNVICYGHGGNGIMIGRNSNNANYWNIYNVSCSNNNVGMYIHDDGGASPDTNAGAAFGCHFANNTSHGLHIENSIDNQFFGLASDGNGGDGIHLSSGAKGHSFFFPYLEVNTGETGIFDSGATENLVFGTRTGTSDSWVDNDSGNDNIVWGRNNSVNNAFFVRGNIGFKDLRIREDASGNDSFINIGISGDDYSIGIDNSDGDQFKISYSSSVRAVPGTTDRLILNASGNFSIGPDTPKAAGLSMSNNMLIARDVNAGLTASTTQTQGNGALTAEINEVSTVANTSDTVTLPAAVVGLKIVVINNGANAMRIFPASGDNLGAGVNTAMATNLAATHMVTFIAYDATNWEGAVSSQSYARNATIIESRILLASSSATTVNNNNILAALITDLQVRGVIG